jgi:orotate phosphoribosyltransferase
VATRCTTHWLSHAWASEEDILFRFMEVSEDLGIPQDFDTLVGTGISGAVIVPTLARLLGVDWAIVRKEDDGTHGWYMIEGVVGAKWLFVDDLVSSGSTVRRVVRIMAELFPNSAPVGAYLYHSKEFNPADDMDRETYE